MNFNFNQGEIISSDSVFDAISAFCMFNMLEVKELQGEEAAVPTRAILSDGSQLVCSVSVTGAITLTLYRHNETSMFTLIRHHQQWHILSAV